MSILRWDKPKKVLTPAQWAKSYGFEDGPTGGYVPNMSEADQLSWKAKIKGTKLGYPQVEIRKTTTRDSLILIIVNLGAGYNYKQYISEDQDYVGKKIEDFPNEFYNINVNPDDYRYDDEKYCYNREELDESAYPTKGINVHLSTNGPIQMTFAEMNEMQMAIEEAKQALESLQK
jgi:hypothetical protein